MVSLTFSIVLLVSISIISLLMFVIFFLVLIWGLFCSSISTSLRCKLRLFEILFLNVGIYCYELLPYQNCFCYVPFSFGMFYFHFCMSQDILFFLWFLLWNWMFSIMLFNLYIFVNFPIFFLQLISVCFFLPLRLEKIFDMISIFSNLLTCFVS